MIVDYFKGLNSMRFFAASLVVITHIELIKNTLGLKNLWKEPIFFEAGSLGVYFFFVLSGFLITYILLKEKGRSGSISLKKFYLKRILRIWPLYYVIFILGFLVLPNIHWFELPYFSLKFDENYWFNFSFYAIIFPNVPYSVIPAVPHIGQSWSIGVEEQFYIFWPFLLILSRNHLRTFVGFTAIYVLFKALVVLVGPQFSNELFYSGFKKFLAMNKFELMSLGAIGAWMIYNDSKLLRIIENRVLAVVSIVGILVLVYFTPNQLQDGVHLAHGVIFLFLILHFSMAKRPLFNLESPVLSYLGTISYGIYMYHLVLVFVAIKVISIWIIIDSIIENILLYVVTFGLSFFVSALSYKYIEKPFLKLKDSN